MATFKCLDSFKRVQDFTKLRCPRLTSNRWLNPVQSSRVPVAAQLCAHTYAQKPAHELRT